MADEGHHIALLSDREDINSSETPSVSFLTIGEYRVRAF
jgi:hypothetical protein